MGSGGPVVFFNGVASSDIHNAVKKYGFLGVRCSKRPDAIDDEVLGILKSNSVTAIELGAQSMNDRVLFMNDRGHTSVDVENASALIKSFFAPFSHLTFNIISSFSG